MGRACEGGGGFTEDMSKVGVSLLQECQSKLHHSTPEVWKPLHAWSQAVQVRFRGEIAKSTL